MSAKRASADGLLGGIIVETPATRRGSRYAWIPIEAFRKLSAGGLKLFALLSGLHRPRKALALSVSECAASLGCCERSLRYWRRELEREGWLEPGCLTIRRANRLRKGYRARVDVTKLAVMSPSLIHQLRLSEPLKKVGGLARGRKQRMERSRAGGGPGDAPRM